MFFVNKKSLRIFGIIALSIILSACGGGASEDSSGQDIPVVIQGSGPGPAPSPAPPAELASRVQGVAPLAVFFDAINVAGVAQPPEVNGRREYANFDYTWNFNDPSSGTWATSGRSKNEAHSYVAAHVFETPGTYTVTLSVKDGIGVDETHQVTITVEDPDVVYAGQSTICVSSTGIFTGCPSNSLHLTTTIVSDVQSYIAPNRRILFRRGDSWTTTAVLQLRNTGPLTIGAYGSCDTPDARGICSNAPIINLTGSSGDGFFSLRNQSDIRVMDLHLVDTGSRSAVSEGVTGLDRLLFLRLKSEGFSTAHNIGFWETRGHDLIAYVDNDTSVSRSMSIRIGSERLMMLGNRLRNPADSHVLRVWQAYKGIIAHNELSGASSTSGTGRHALKLHGPEVSTLNDTGPLGLNRQSQYIVVADNLIGGSGPWPMAIGPHDDQGTEYLNDIIVENNNFYPGAGTSLSKVQVALHVWASFTTVRNNVFYGGDSANSYSAINISRRGIEPNPTGNNVYNNTIYKSDGTGNYTGISIGSSAANTTIKNNLIHLNENANISSISDSGTNTIESNNLLTNTPGLVDPDNANFMAKNFSLESNSVAVNAGTNVPVLVDHDGGERTLGGATDLGAFERQ